MTLSGKAKIAGVIGWPISHSLSPVIHGYWLAKLGIDGAYVPLAVDPAEDGLARAVQGLKALGFRGANVTIPHKVDVMGLVDSVDDVALRIGAVNTLVVRRDNGTLEGRNTDAFGFMENLKQGAAGVSFPGGAALVLGAGGAARACITALLDEGVDHILLTNRTRTRADDLAAQVGSAKIEVVDWDRRSDILEGIDVLVNTTSLGMTGQPPLEISLDALPGEAVVNDIVYAPLETPLLADARARGNVAVDGLGMLLHQARPGFEAWFGAAPEVDDALRKHVLDVLAARA